MALFDIASLTQLASRTFHILDAIDITFWDPALQSWTDRFRFISSTRDVNVGIDGVDVLHTGGFTAELVTTSTDYNLNRKSITFKFTGLSQALIQIVQGGRHVGAEFTLRKVILNEDMVQQGNAVIVYKGIIESGGYVSQPTGSSLTLQGTHTLYNFSQVKAVKSNAESYSNWVKNRLGLSYGTEFANIDNKTEILWGPQKGLQG